MHWGDALAEKDEKIEELQSEIERLRAALREIAEWPAIGSRPLTIARKALSYSEQNVCPTCKKAESKFCSDAWHLVHS